MLDLLPDNRRRKLRVLCIGAHCDDIEIGTGAAQLALQSRFGADLTWVSLTGDERRQNESRQAMHALVQARHRGRLLFGGFSDRTLPAQYAAVKEFFESLKQLPRPDVIFCHEREDRHQDHRLVNEMVWNTFRDHLIMEYEIPKWDGGLGQPNFYIPVSRKFARQKIRAILTSHRSQLRRDWFEEETFMALLRLRGVECRSKSGLAEAFHVRKARIGL